MKVPLKISMLLLSRFSHVQLCATPEMTVHQAPPSLGFSRQEHWSGLPFPSPMHESEKWKWSRSVLSDSSQPHGLQPTRLLRPWDFPSKSTGVGCHCLLQKISIETLKKLYLIFGDVHFYMPTSEKPMKIRTEPTEWEKLIAKHISDKRLVFIILRTNSHN